MGSGWVNPRAPGLRVPLHSSVPAKIQPTLSKIALKNVFIVWLQISHKDAFHKLIMKSELLAIIWVSLQLGLKGQGGAGT